MKRRISIEMSESELIRVVEAAFLEGQNSGLAVAGGKPPAANSHEAYKGLLVEIMYGNFDDPTEYDGGVTDHDDD